jgi:RNA polymerase sigma-70 factor (ECF subfamily)
MRLAIDDLPPEFRLAVLLADLEGYAYKEIAEMLQCPIGTVMSRLYRGRQLLKTTLRTLIES